MRPGTDSAASHFIRMTAMICGLVSTALRGEPAGPEPARPGQMTDKLGNRWTLTPSGNLSGSSLPIRRGWVPYLSVDDQSHGYSTTPPKADKKPRPKLMETPSTLASDARFDFHASEQRDVQWTHFVRFDSARGGMRFIDVFSNAGSEAHGVRIRMDSDINVSSSDAFQGATLGNGEILSSENPALPDEASAVMFHFTPGFSPALPLFVVGGVQSPWTANRTVSGYRMTLEYSGTLEPGRRAVLVHWIAGRGARETGKPEKAIERFISNGKLIEPGVPEEWLADVINFPKEAFQTPPSVPTDGKVRLVMLDLLCKRLGIERHDGDHLLLDGGTRIKGDATIAKARLVRGGKTLDLAVKDIAAISGGGGMGREHRVFLRDGSVLAGHVNLEGARFTSQGAGDVVLNADALDCLVLRETTTTSAPPAIAGVAKTNRGEILLIESLPSSPFKGHTSVGAVEVPWSDITSVRERTSPDPCSVVTLKDGSRVLCLPALHDTVFRLAGGGEWDTETELNGYASSTGGLEALLAPEKEGDGKPEGGWCELIRGTVWAGKVSGGHLEIDSAAGLTKLKAADIKSIRRPGGLVAPTGAGDVFEVELKTGLKLHGRFQTAFLRWQRGSQSLELPWSQIVEVGTEAAK